MSPWELAVLKEFLKENLAKVFIQESKSLVSTPILFVPKKDGSLRLYVNYRGLNSIIVKNRYPLPLITEIVDRVTGANYFSKIDLKDVYYSGSRDNRRSRKTANQNNHPLIEIAIIQRKIGRAHV